MKQKQLKKKIQRTNNAVQTFIKSTIKNYKSMKKKIFAIWACIAMAFVVITTTSCNVTRTITNQSEYYQRGDTSVVIQTKTIETYDATKKGF